MRVRGVVYVCMCDACALQGGPGHERVRAAVPAVGQGYGRQCRVPVARSRLLGMEESRVGVGRRKVVLEVRDVGDGIFAAASISNQLRLLFIC